MTRRWRPSLAFVLCGALGGTLALSFAGLVALRYLGPEIGFRGAAALLGGIIVLATAVLGWLLVRLLLRPILALEQFALDYDQGHVAPPGHFGTRELQRTAQAVMAMVGTLRDREATVRSFTDHVTHELRTPVSAIRVAVELIEDSGKLGQEDRVLLAQVEGTGRQIETQLAALREVAQAREVRYLGNCTLADMGPPLAVKWPGIALDMSGANLPIPMAAEGLRIVLVHLLRNATEHGASRVTLDAAVAGEHLVLDVTDNGTGISGHNAARVFDPFFTSRRETGGTGMGLTIVRNILAAHGAQIALAPQTQGAHLRVTFPAGR